MATAIQSTAIQLDIISAARKPGATTLDLETTIRWQDEFARTGSKPYLDLFKQGDAATNERLTFILSRVLSSQEFLSFLSHAILERDTIAAFQLSDLDAANRRQASRISNLVSALEEAERKLSAAETTLAGCESVCADLSQREAAALQTSSRFQSAFQKAQVRIAALELHILKLGGDPFAG